MRAAENLLAETGLDPQAIDVVMYYGSMWRDYAVWQSAPHIAHRIGATNAFAIEYGNVSMDTMTSDEWERAEELKAERDKNRDAALARRKAVKALKPDAGKADEAKTDVIKPVKPAQAKTGKTDKD